MGIPIIPRKPGFAERINASFQQNMPAIGELLLQHQKSKQIEDILNPKKPTEQGPAGYESLGIPEQEKMGGQFNDLMLGMEQQAGREFSPDETNQVWQNLQLNAQQPQSQNQQPQQAQPGRFSPDQILAMAQIDPQMANTMAQLYNAQEKAGQHEREFNYQRAGKALTAADEERAAVDQSKLNLSTMKSAIQKNEVGFFSPSNISKMMGQISGVDLPLDATGAQLATASKNMLISTLNSVGGARPNQFIEQQIDRGMPRIGQSEQANMASYLPIEASVDIKEKYLNALDDLNDYYMQKQGYPPADLARQAQKHMRPWLNERMKKLENDLKENLKNKDGSDLKMRFESLDDISSQKKPKKGDKARNKKTGETFVWNGKSWEKSGS